MKPYECSWLDASETIGLPDLARTCGWSVDDLEELIDYGALTPVRAPAAERLFSASCVPTLRTVCKLRLDFDLDLFTVALLMDYVNRIEELKQEVRTLQAHLPKHVSAVHREGPEPWHEPHAKSRACRL